MKRILPFISIAVILLSCWKYSFNNGDNNNSVLPKTWGYKPLYAVDSFAKRISYIPTAQPVVSPGNIYAYQNYIFQMDPGSGIHVIDNTVPSSAKRIGFIVVRGCSEISIKEDKLYTNSYDDLVVLDCSSLNNIHEYSRLKGVFSEYRYSSPLAQPPASGYYQCPVYDSLVIGWVKDSVFQNCYKN